mgnify:FL=1
MKSKKFDENGKKKGSKELPDLFNTEFKPTAIKKAVLSIMANKRQKYGSDPKAGNRSSAHYHGHRDDRYTMMNREMSRMQRIHSGGFLHMTARNVPQARKGRKAHPPKSEKNFSININKKEKKLAVKSALAATKNKEMIETRGHKFLDSPLIVDNSLEDKKKTKNVYQALLNMGMDDELKRCKEKKVRSGKGKRRGRKYKRKTGPLIIVSDACSLSKSARNIPGVSVRTAQSVNALDLAPGGVAGRLTIITEKALDVLEKRFGE